MTVTPIDKDVLHERLSSICPDPTVPDRSRIPALARSRWLDVTSAAVYKWINEGQVPAARVPALVRMQEEVFGEVRVPAGELNLLFAPADRNKS